MNILPIVALIFLLPSAGWACAVCVGGNEPNRMAIIFTTILLTVVPLVVIGSAVRWIQKRSEQRDAAPQSSPTEGH